MRWKKRAVESIGGIKTLHLTDKKLLFYRLFATSSTVSPLLKEFEIFVWDIRVGKSHALAFNAQKDVNVISSNRFFCQASSGNKQLT
ncbi:hypothetical protein F2Q69_00027270 [Brassica cretica]|uniref:Uncharacterized protein n=1 Tax=Brassica cretica TaxID=69181 RepID=A0A8S9S021_BRACR|nr:hypothetical protein F2Q69_00027270 [Brassica cretica]